MDPNDLGGVLRGFARLVEEPELREEIRGRCESAAQDAAERTIDGLRLPAILAEALKAEARRLRLSRR